MQMSKKTIIILLCVLTASHVVSVAQDSDMNRFIDALMSRMTLHEKIGQLNLPTGNEIVSGLATNDPLAELIRRQECGGFLNVKDPARIREYQRIAVEETDLKIPLLAGADIVHGYQTVFPIPLALSCSWDTTAVERMAHISAIEASAGGINWTYSPMVDICHDARWGRIAEGSGEDPYLGSKFAAAYVRGYQGDMSSGDNILSCMKHYALYGASEAGLDYNTVDMSRIRMFNEYFAPFQAAVDAGVGSVMTSFNVVDGVPATANRWLLNDVLRDSWHFDGFVVTDYNAIEEMDVRGVAKLPEASVLAFQAGTDMDMVSSGFLNHLEKAVADGKVKEEQIDSACRRILEAKYRLGLFDNPYRHCKPETASEVIYSPEHRAAAREIAAETFVLLKNSDNLLPLARKGKIALVGPMADAREQMCGMWALSCDPSKYRSLLESMRDAVGDSAEILYAKGSNIYLDSVMEAGAAAWRPLERGDNDRLLSEALAVAENADVIVAALGECAEMSGESVSRSSLDIPDAQSRLLKAMVATGKPVVLLLFTGRPLTLNWEVANVPAILDVWYGGSEAGDAIADVVFGDKTPAGKLTATFPRAVGQLPMAYNHLSTGRPDPEEGVFNHYQSNYLDVSTKPLFPFGYGLSYTKFDYSDLRLSNDVLSPDGKITATVTVTNTGNRDGIEIVQLYIRDCYASICRPVKELKAFRRVFLKKGECRDITFELTEKDLRFYNTDLQHVSEPGEFSIMIGPNSSDLICAKFTLTD